MPLLRRSLLLLIPGALLWGCEARDPEALYAGGSYLEAREFYNPRACKDVSTAGQARCMERSKELERAFDGAARFLGKRANELTQHGEIAQNDYPEAIRSLKLAIRLMKAHPVKIGHYEAELQKLFVTTSALEGEYENLIGQVEALLESGAHESYALWKTRIAYERLELITLALRLEDERPREVGLKLVAKLRSHSQYERAFQVAQVVHEFAERTGTATRASPTDNELIGLGALALDAEEQEEKREQEIGKLVEEVTQHERAKRMADAAESAKKVLALSPDKKVSNRMRRLIKRVEGVDPIEVLQHRLEMTRIAPGKLSVKPLDRPPANSGTGVVSAGVAAAAPSQKSAEPLSKEDFARRLRELELEYRAGDKHRAMSDLKNLIEDNIDERHVAAAVRLDRKWSPYRKALTDSLLGEADDMYTQMDERCYELYERVKELHPPKRVSEHVARRLAILDRIFKSSSPPRQDSPPESAE